MHPASLLFRFWPYISLKPDAPVPNRAARPSVKSPVDKARRYNTGITSATFGDFRTLGRKVPLGDVRREDFTHKFFVFPSVKQASADSDWLNEIGGCLLTLDERACWEDFTQNLGTRLWRTQFPDNLKAELVDKAIVFSNEANDISLICLVSGT